MATPVKPLSATLLVLGLTAAPARADDKSESVTVVPWTSASLVFVAGDKRGVVEYTHLFGGQSFYVKASAPIDEDSRVAAFTGDNRFAKGFAGGFQWGIDQRALALASLEKSFSGTMKVLKELTSIREELSQGEWMSYVRRSGLAADTDALATSLCTAAGVAPCTPVGVAKGVCTKLGGCGAAGDDAAQIAAANATASAELATCRVPPAAPDDTFRDRCFIAKFWLHVQYQEHHYDAVRHYFADTAMVDRVWAVYELVDDAAAGKALGSAGGNKAQAVIDNQEAIAAAFKKVLRQKQLARRDLLLTGVLASGDDAWAFAVDGSLSYDRKGVYQDDLASKPRDTTTYELGLGASLTLYPAAATGVGLNLRVGLERSRETGAEKVERCVSRDSMDAGVAGKSCDPNALFRTGGAPDPESSGYLRVAATYQYRRAGAEDTIVPGVEVRAGLEGLGADKSLTARLTLFGTPIKGTSAARVGVALDTAFAIDAADDERTWTITPLVFIGASFSDVFNSSL